MGTVKTIYSSSTIFHYQHDRYGYGSIPINTIFSGMNIHLPAILMFTRGTRFWHTAIYHSWVIKIPQWPDPWPPRRLRRRSAELVAAYRLSHQWQRGWLRAGWETPGWIIWNYDEFWTYELEETHISILDGVSTTLKIEKTSNYSWDDWLADQYDIDREYCIWISKWLVPERYLFLYPLFDLNIRVAGSWSRSQGTDMGWEIPELNGGFQLKQSSN